MGQAFRKTVGPEGEALIADAFKDFGRGMAKHVDNRIDMTRMDQHRWMGTLIDGSNTTNALLSRIDRREQLKLEQKAAERRALPAPNVAQLPAPPAQAANAAVQPNAIGPNHCRRCFHPVGNLRKNLILHAFACEGLTNKPSKPFVCARCYDADAATKRRWTKLTPAMKHVKLCGDKVYVVYDAPRMQQFKDVLCILFPQRQGTIAAWHGFLEAANAYAPYTKDANGNPLPRPTVQLNAVGRVPALPLPPLVARAGAPPVGAGQALPGAGQAPPAGQ